MAEDANRAAAGDSGNGPEAPPAVKQALRLMPGLPGPGDPELAALAAAVPRMPRAALEEVTRCLLRAALAFSRSGDPAFLACLAADALLTAGLRARPGHDKALALVPAVPGTGVDVEEMLRERGL